VDGRGGRGEGFRRGGEPEFGGVPGGEHRASGLASGEGQTVVVQKGIDQATMNGQTVDVSFVGYFRVRDGRIIEWQDVASAGDPPD
jgi:hypothetical protein